MASRLLWTRGCGGICRTRRRCPSLRALCRRRWTELSLKNDDIAAAAASPHQLYLPHFGNHRFTVGGHCRGNRGDGHSSDCLAPVPSVPATHRFRSPGATSAPTMFPVPGGGGSMPRRSR